MSKKPEFPKTIWVVREHDHDHTFLVAHESIDGVVAVGDKTKVAIYQLEQLVEAEGHVRIIGVR